MFVFCLEQLEKNGHLEELGVKVRGVKSCVISVTELIYRAKYRTRPESSEQNRLMKLCICLPEVPLTSTGLRRYKRKRQNLPGINL